MKSFKEFFLEEYTGNTHPMRAFLEKNGWEKTKTREHPDRKETKISHSFIKPGTNHKVLLLTKLHNKTGVSEHASFINNDVYEHPKDDNEFKSTIQNLHSVSQHKKIFGEEIKDVKPEYRPSDHILQKYVDKDLDTNGKYFKSKVDLVKSHGFKYKSKNSKNGAVKLEKGNHRILMRPHGDFLHTHFDTDKNHEHYDELDNLDNHLKSIK